MLVLLAVTIGTDSALSIGLGVTLAIALVAAVKANEKQASRITAVEKLGPRVKALEDHDKEATELRHALELRIVAQETRGTESSGIHGKPPG